MRTIFVAAVMSSIAFTFAAADPFFEPRGLSARDQATIQRAIAQAYATDQQTYGKIQVHNGAGGTTICNQGVIENTDGSSGPGAFNETIIVVEDSVNVCFGN